MFDTETIHLSMPIYPLMIIVELRVRIIEVGNSRENGFLIRVKAARLLRAAVLQQADRPTVTTVPDFAGTVGRLLSAQPVVGTRSYGTNNHPTIRPDTCGRLQFRGEIPKQNGSGPVV